MEEGLYDQFRDVLSVVWGYVKKVLALATGRWRWETKVESKTKTNSVDVVYKLQTSEHQSKRATFKPCLLSPYESLKGLRTLKLRTVLQGTCKPIFFKHSIHFWITNRCLVLYPISITSKFQMNSAIDAVKLHLYVLLPVNIQGWKSLIYSSILFKGKNG